MDVDFAKLYRHIQQLVESGAGVREGMLAMIQICSELAKHGIWDELAQLDFESDVEDLHSWLEGVLREEPPAPAIQALWFGLFDAFFDTKEEENLWTVLYVAGSERFEGEVCDLGWACGPAYFPEGRYAQSWILRDLYLKSHALRHGDMDIHDPVREIFRLCTYFLCLGYASLAAAELCKSIDPSLLLGERERRHVGVGFDDGDWIWVGDITKSGFECHKRS